MTTRRLPGTINLYGWIVVIFMAVSYTHLDVYKRQAMGFSHMSSIFLGGMLSMSSTAIVFKAFNDMGLLQQDVYKRQVCRPYICKYGIYGIVTYPRQGKRTETTLFLTVWI